MPRDVSEPATAPPRRTPDELNLIARSEAPGSNGGAPPQPTPQAVPQPEATQAQPEPKKPEGPWIGKLPLRKKVQAHGEWVTELTFREPTGADIEECGNPLSVTPDGMKFETRNMAAMMAQLAMVPPGTIKRLHPKDWMNGAFLIAGFFTPDL
jgi:hypothetical protein